MSAVHQTEIDGVTCFWVDSGRPTLSSKLVFRYGAGDEPVAESGWQHLLEHLALHRFDGGRLQVNGSVDILTTAFDAHGPAELVTAHLTDLTRWLARPVTDDLAREVGVLRSEAEYRGGNPLTHALSWRYGAQGPGILGLPEPGLGRASARALRSRAARAFVTGNAVLILDGPPPANLRLGLREGSRVDVPTAVPCETQFPGAYVDAAGLTLTGVVERSSVLWATHELLRAALNDDLRGEAGGAYAPWATYERLDTTSALVAVGSDLASSLREQGAEIALASIDRLRQQGPDPARLSDLLARREQELLDPYAAAGHAALAAYRHLERLPPKTLAALRDEAHDITSDDVATAVEGWAQSLLIGVPGETTLTDDLVAGRVPLLAMPSTEPVAGHSFRHRNWPAIQVRLSLDLDGVERVQDGKALRILWADLAGTLVYEDGVRHLFRPDGYGLTIDPHEWRGGGEILAEIDRRTPPSLQLPMGRDGGGSIEPMGGWTRWRNTLVNAIRATDPRARATVLVAVGIAFVLYVVPHIPRFGTSFGN